MAKALTLTRYSPLEEKINYTSHALGALLSFIATVFLIKKAWEFEGMLHFWSVLIFGLCVVTTFTASAFYHFSQDEKKRYKLKILDHAAIYCFIAGSYTPVTLIALGGDLGFKICLTVWIIAAIGITLKLFFTGRFKLVSTSMYILMGWIIVFFNAPLSKSVSEQGFNWLLAGGISYTVGAIFYSFKKVQYTHAIFHLFVLAGCACHLIMVYFYVLDS